MPKTEAARSFGVGISSVKRYAKLVEEGRPLAPKKCPGSKPKARARTREALIEAMGRALAAVTVEDARGFFGHRGYRHMG